MKSISSLFTIALIVFLFYYADANFARKYKNCFVISYDYDFRVYWNVTGNNVNVGIMGTAPNGYLSIAMARVGSRMDGGPNTNDFADAWAFSYPNVYLDTWMPDESQPRTDTNNLQNMVITRNTTHLFGEFDRLLVTGDSHDYPISLTDPIYLISAVHPTRAIQAGEDIPEHRWWGSTQINWGGDYTCDTTTGGGNTYTTGDGKFTLTWNMVANNRINFTMEAAYTGWISFGLNRATATTPKMANADCYTGWVTDATNAVTLLDTWSPDSVNQPRLDTSLGGASDVADIAGYQTGGKTYITFTRPLDTGDVNNDVAITDTDYWVVLAWHATSDGDGAGNYVKHAAYTAARLNFFGSSNGTTGGGGGGGGTVVGGTDPTGPEFVNTDGDVKLQWEIRDPDIVFKLSVQTTGWVSVGVSLGSTMIDADYWTGWVDGTNVYLFDTWSTAKVLPDRDIDIGGTDDLQIFRGEEANGWTTIVFSRPLQTTDQNDVPITDSTMYVHWALHTSNEGPSGIYTLSEHTKYGVTQINFFSGSISSSIVEITPGLVLSVGVAGLGLVYLTFRYTNKCLKACKGRKARKIKKVSSGKVESGKPAMRGDPHKYQDRYQQNPGYYGVGGSHDTGHVMPTGKTYYRGSQRYTSPVDVSAYGYDESDISAITKNQGTSYEEIEVDPGYIPVKHSGNKVSNFLSGVMNVRLPKADYSLQSLLIAILYVGANVGCLWVMPSDMASGLGTLIAANLLFVTLPATRNSLLVYLCDFPFDKTIMYHRWMGRWAILLTIWHTIWIIVNWVTTGMDWIGEIKKLSNIYGIIGLAMALIIFITSIEVFRRKKFEFFFYSHFAFIGYFVFGCLHSEKMWPYAIAAAALYVLDRIIRIFWGFLPVRSVKLKIKDEKNAVIQIVFPKNRLASLLNTYRAGQYAFLNFPTISLLEWHPFSISSGPDEKTLEVHIKGLGNHTQKLIEKAKGKSHLWLRADGPYGNQKINYRRFPVLFLCAGGIGVTPVMSILKDIYKFGELDPKAKPHRSQLEKVYVCYTIQSEEMYNWFSDEWAAFYDQAQKGGQGNPQLILNIYVTRPTGKLESSFFIKGRPDFKNIFDTISNDNPGKATMVFVCGPKQIVNTCWDLSMQKNRKGHRFHYHHETFEF